MIKFVITSDGSQSIQIENWKESYHSKHGAIQEAQHVFIDNGLQLLKPNINLKILEYGFGTGLNALMTIKNSIHSTRSIEYYSIEKYPITQQEFETINYGKDMNLELEFELLHQIQWEKLKTITPNFHLKKITGDFINFEKNSFFDIVFFDAFGSRVQPELWEKPMIEKTIRNLKPGGLFVTYACKGSLKRLLKSLNCVIEKRVGPPGKREMLIAYKND